MVTITPEIQQQLDEQKKNCIFCKIVAGSMESKKVYEDSKILGVLDINPAVKGHMLLLPKEHYPIMPYIPADVFSHLFGMMAPLVAAVKKSLLYTGANTFIANGGVAGQQSPHFLIHLLGREKGDKVTVFDFSSKKVLDNSKAEQVNNMLANNVPLMMRNHFTRNPAAWHTGSVITADFLSSIKSDQKLIYEDEKVLCVVSSNPQCLGHLEIYSHEEEKDFEKLSKESAAHLFYVASFCATAVFEGLGAQGSNIILKSGVSGDNVCGKLCLHILPRFQNDGLDFLWKPMEPKPNMDSVAGSIRNKTFILEQSLKPKKEHKVIDLSSRTEHIVIENGVVQLDGSGNGSRDKDSDKDAGGEDKEGDGQDKDDKNQEPEDEVAAAIRQLKKK